MFHLFARLDFFGRFGIPKEAFAKFIMACEDGYKDNPYHNKIHAADVVQSTFFFLQTESFAAQVTDIEVCASLIAAATHDYAHPGTNNSFQTNSETELAVRYNDMSVLENMHAAEAFFLLRREDQNIFGSMPLELKREFRQLIISMILATDMTSHVKNLAHLTATLDSREAEQGRTVANQLDDHTPEEVLAWRHLKAKDPKDRLLASETALHCADIGNPTKPFSLHKRWSDFLMEEFHAQGDRERELGLPMIADRQKPNQAKSQIGFFDILIKPLYTTFQRFVPEVEVCLLELSRNYSHWLHVAKQEDAEDPSSPPMEPQPPPGGEPRPSLQEDAKA
jgi:hypothetical protein